MFIVGTLTPANAFQTNKYRAQLKKYINMTISIIIATKIRFIGKKFSVIQKLNF